MEENFKADFRSKCAILNDCIENREYWKALRLLYSLEQNSQFSVLLSYKLHSRLPYFQSVDDDCIRMILSNNPDSVVNGVRAISSLSEFSDEEIITFLDFAKKRLNNFVKSGGPEIIFDENKNSGLSFVENHALIEKHLNEIDVALGSGEYEKAIELSEQMQYNPLALMMSAEAFLLKGDAKKAKFNLDKIENKDRDLYFECLDLRVNAKLKKRKSFNNIIKTLPQKPEELTFVVESLLDVGYFEEAINFIDKCEKKFEFYYPLHFAKGIAYYNLGLYENAKNEFMKTYILYPKQILAKEMALLLERNKKFGKVIMLHQQFPKFIVESIEKKFNKHLKTETEKLKYIEIYDMINWLELIQNEYVAEKYLLKLTTSAIGLEAIIRTLTSFHSSDWMKGQCIKILVYSGIDNIYINYIFDRKMCTVKTVLPKLDFLDEFNEDTDFNYNLYMHIYATAFSTLAFETKNFEKRLLEVFEKFQKNIYSESFKHKKNKSFGKFCLALILLATCSDCLPFKFENDKVLCSKFSNYSNVASEFELTTDDLKTFSKNMFS